MKDLEKEFPDTYEGNKKLVEEFQKKIKHQTMEQDLPESDEEEFKTKTEEIKTLKEEILKRMKSEEEPLV